MEIMEILNNPVAAKKSQGQALVNDFEPIAITFILS